MCVYIYIYTPFEGKNYIFVFNKMSVFSDDDFIRQSRILLNQGHIHVD